ncbi:hypothetical protein Clacol_007223 [Clathrus columnatus]|uniref:Uncharacterized protein n=1 Tax=Clathrus columnatus TaxID=1419009 RepID=A0AAV5AEB4_9AGAM|nr:hypothetical protein Clacol_007223 [Clathrus columnatus]
MTDTTTPPQSRLNPASIEVIGLGLGRTGTMSLWAALNILGFGPAYHPMQSPTEAEDWSAWAEIIEGRDTSPEAFDEILRGYKSAVDSQVAVMFKEVYAAYPNAKFVLTVRDPSKWENSLKATVLKARELTDKNQVKPKMEGKARWAKTYFDVYHKGRLATHAKEELEEHTENVKSTIPADQLLVYDVKEGWDRLAEFLGVPKPDIPFPHLNETQSYHQVIITDIEEKMAQKAMGV